MSVENLDDLGVAISLAYSRISHRAGSSGIDVGRMLLEDSDIIALRPGEPTDLQADREQLTENGQNVLARFSEFMTAWDPDTQEDYTQALLDPKARRWHIAGQAMPIALIPGDNKGRTRIDAIPAYTTGHGEHSKQLGWVAINFDAVNPQRPRNSRATGEVTAQVVIPHKEINPVWRQHPTGGSVGEWIRATNASHQRMMRLLELILTAD